MKTYRIQRGEIREEINTNKKGIDMLINFDYMGASEYEWGALPESLVKIRKYINEYTYLDVPINKKVITVFCLESEKSDVKTYLNEIANGTMLTKMGSYFDKYIKPSKHELKWQSKNPLKTNFWWDLDNDLMFWVKNPNFEIQFKNVIETKPSK